MKKTFVFVSLTIPLIFGVQAEASYHPISTLSPLVQPLHVTWPTPTEAVTLPHLQKHNKKLGRFDESYTLF